MSSFADAVANAAYLSKHPDAFLFCTLRGEPVGERVCKSCGSEKLKPVRTCPYHPAGVVIVQECRRCLRVVPDRSKRIVYLGPNGEQFETPPKLAPGEADPDGGQFVDEGNVRRWRLPECAWRGDVLDSLEVECCGGLFRVDERFTCYRPENTAKVTFSKMCAHCTWPKEKP